MAGITHSQLIAFCLVVFPKSTKIEQRDFDLGILATQEWGGLLKVYAHTYGITASVNTNFCRANQTKPFQWFTF